MKPISLATMTVEQLIDRFAEIGIAQDQALFYDEHAKFIRLYGQMDAVDEELRARGRDARVALLDLYTHPNIQVRLKAAVRTLGVAPVEARRIIQEIKASEWMPQALDAGMTLRGLDDGTFKPD